MSKYDFSGDLIGRLISINQMKCKKFSCGGFSVNFNNPAAVVTPASQQDRIRMGLMDGRLIDISDQNINGLDLKGAQHTKPVLEDTGEKVFITVTADGSMSVAIPKDEAELAKFETQIEESGGVLILDSPKISKEISPLAYGSIAPSDRSNMIKNFNRNISNMKKDLK
jgi:hypothetical protein